MNTNLLLFIQVPCGHSDVPAVQQRLDQGEDLRAPAASGPTSWEVKAGRKGGSQEVAPIAQI